MLLLAVDTSSAQVSSALVDVAPGRDPRPLAARELVAANRHGEHLAVGIRQMLVDARVPPAAISAVCAGVGPGPFTGLRVGIVTALTFADALGLPSYAVCSLDAIALRHKGSGPLLVCSDARRKQVYWARYDDGAERIEGPELAAATDLGRRFAEVVAVAVGAGSSLYAEALAPISVDGDAPYPSAVDVAALGAARALAGAPSERLDPLYLRRPDAVPPGAPKAVTPR